MNLDHSKIGGSMKKILVVMLMAVSAVGQEHATSVATCQADRALWYSSEQEIDYNNQQTKQISDGIKNTNPSAKLALQEVKLRVIEMGNCMSIDKTQQDAYLDAQRFYASVMHDRWRGFIQRHHLMEQLEAEDKKGVR